MSEDSSQLLSKAKRALGLEEDSESSLLTGGVINANWRVATSLGSYVVRIYPAGRRARQVAFEVALHEHLRERGCPVPRVLRPQNGEAVPTAEGRCVVLLEHLNARPLAFDEGRLLPPERLAALLGPIDAALEEFSPPFRPVHETRVFSDRLEPLFAQCGEDREKFEDLFRRLQDWENQTTLPSRVIHADIHAGNVLLGEGQPLATGDLWLIDFDDAHVSHRAIDWILPAIEFSLRADGTLDEARYEELLSLLGAKATKEERAAFPTLRAMMLLKFAASYAQMGQPLARNPYLLALLREA